MLKHDFEIGEVGRWSLAPPSFHVPLPFFAEAKVSSLWGSVSEGAAS